MSHPIRIDFAATDLEALAARPGRLAVLADPGQPLSPAARRLDISARASGPSQRFQLLHQIALLTQNELLEATLDLARFSTDEARDIAKIGLANYFAGAALLPYRAFLAAAQEVRHDLERLASCQDLPSGFPERRPVLLDRREHRRLVELEVGRQRHADEADALQRC